MHTSSDHLITVEDYEIMLDKSIERYKSRSFVSTMFRIVSRHERLRTALLRLIDGGCSEDFYNMVRGFSHELPFLVRAVLAFGDELLSRKISDLVAHIAVEKILAPYFLITDDAALKRIVRRYEKDGTGIIWDIVGEEALTTAQARRFFISYIRMMRYLCSGGKIAIKLSSLAAGLLFEEANYEANEEFFKMMLRMMLRAAKKYNVSVTLDAEEFFKYCKLFEDVFCEVIAEDEFRDMHGIGIALQAYRKDAYASAKRLVAVAKMRAPGYRVYIRLVKGAYWGTELCISEKNGWDFPLFRTKRETDESWNEIFDYLYENREYIRVCPATQNLKNIAHALWKSGKDFADIEFQVLFGLGEGVRRTLRSLGISVSVYTPKMSSGGSIADAIAYLVRRLLENLDTESCLLKYL